MRKHLQGLLMFFFVSAFLTAGHNIHAQNGKPISIPEALKKISKVYGTEFFYDKELLQQKSTSYNIEANRSKPVEEVLKSVLYPNGFLFVYIKNNYYTIVPKDRVGEAVTNERPVQGNAATVRSVSGNITNAEGAALPSVSVAVKGTNKGTITNDRGDYYLPDVTGNNTIVISMVGYKSMEIPVNNLAVVNVVMAPLAEMMSEVSIISNGYQQLPKERTTGSVASISSKQIEQTPSPNIIQRLEGQLAGVQVNVSAGDRSFTYMSGVTPSTILGLNAGTRTIGRNDYDISIRGISSYNGEKFPLVVVDGAISEFDLSNFNPSDIDNITFLKDAAAASIWGVRAANGVIVITTKRGRKMLTPTVTFSTNFMVAGRPNLDYVKTMHAEQTLAYEKELVDRNFLPYITGNSYGAAAAFYYAPGTNLAQQLKAGVITKSQYDAQIGQLSAIDNREQIKKYVLQGATSQQYNLAVSGGNDFSNYYYSLSYSKEQPSTQKNIGQRVTATMNNSWKLFNTATLATSLKANYFQYSFNPIGLSTLYSNNVYSLMPYQLLADGNGNGLFFDRLNPAFTGNLSPAYRDWRYNYLSEQENASNVQKDNNYIGNVSLRVPLIKGLSASGFFNMEKSFSHLSNYSNQATYKLRNLVNYYTHPAAATNSLGITNGGILEQINTTQSNYSLRGQLDFDRAIGTDHRLVALAGSEIRETNAGQYTGTLFGYNQQTGFTNSNINFSSTPTYSYIDAFTPTSYTTFNAGGYPSQADKRRRFLSYYSNAAYTFLDKYVASGSVRYDDYNNFGLDRKHRATPLWSAGLKWMASKEAFLKSVPWLNNLNVRSTYGVNGNLSLSTFPFTWIGASSADFVTGREYAFIVAIANPELKWEKTFVTNLGVDFSMFRSRLNGSIDAYKKRSTDLLYSFPISNVYVGTVGSGFITRNTATLNGKGIDLALNGLLLEKGDWNWNAGLTFSYNNNKVADTRFSPSLYANSFGSNPLGIGLIKDYPTDKLFVYRFAGLDARGLTQVFDEKGAIVPATTSAISSLDALKYAGRITAPYFGGLNTSLRFKQFTFYALTTYQFGNVFLKPLIQNYVISNRTVNYDLSAAIADRWKKAGDEATTNIPGLNGTATAVNNSLNRFKNADINVLKGDYIRLRQLSLVYDIPTSFAGKYHIKGFQVGVSVNNLGLLWTANKEGYDPDFVIYPGGGNRSYPPARSFNFNLNVKF